MEEDHEAGTSEDGDAGVAVSRLCDLCGVWCECTHQSLESRERSDAAGQLHTPYPADKCEDVSPSDVLVHGRGSIEEVLEVLHDVPSVQQASGTSGGGIARKLDSPNAFDGCIQQVHADRLDSLPRFDVPSADMDAAAGMEVDQAGEEIIPFIPAPLRKQLCLDEGAPATATAAAAAGATHRQAVAAASDDVFRVWLNPNVTASLPPIDVDALQREFADWFPGPSCCPSAPRSD
jgi:hypothetical protein